MNGRQQTIDFNRGDQLAMLRLVNLGKAKAKDGCGVSVMAQKSVLRAIDELAGYKRGVLCECWASLDLIADVSGVARRQVVRTIDVLIEKSIITCERKWNATARAVRNHYRVVWSELSLIVNQPRPEAETGPATATVAMAAEEARPSGTTEANPVLVGCETDYQPDAQASVRLYQPESPDMRNGQNHRAVERWKPPDQSAVVTDQSAVVTDQSAVVTDQSAVVAHNPPIPAMIRPDPPGSSGSRACGNRRGSNAARAAAADLVSVIGRMLRDVGLAHWRSLADEFSDRGVAAVEAAIRVYEANRSRLRPPAIVWNLRNGTWPEDDLVDPDRERELAAVRRKRETAERRTMNATTIIRELRKRRCSDEVIEAELKKRGLEWPK